VKLLLTSGGVTNASIRDALVELLGKPIAESSALCIPTAQYGHPMVGPGVKAWQFISGNSPNPMVDLGWRSVGVLELTALPSIDEERWVPLVQEADALLVAGGTSSTCATGCGSPGWRTCCRPWVRRSGWDSARGAW
jgi:dipeptidase E